MDSNGNVRKRRKCISKAERLAKRNQTKSNSENYNQQIYQLLQSSRSEDWDVASRLATTIQLQILFLIQMVQMQRGKAAFHYLNRWNSLKLTNISVLLDHSQLLAALKENELCAAAFLNSFSDKELTIENHYRIFNNFVVPWLCEGKDAPLQALLQNYSTLKWLLLEHTLVTGQGRHLINQYAFLCQDIRHSPHIPWKFENHIRNDDERRENARKQIELTIKTAWPDARAYLFGSSMTGLCCEKDDVDICIVIPSCPVRGQNSADLAVDIHGHLSMYSMANSSVIKNARIPIIKTEDVERKLQLDLSINNTAAMWNSVLICAFLEYFPKLTPLSMYIRKWAKSRGLVGSPHSLSSYSIELMVIHWAQVRGYVPFVDVAYHESLDISLPEIHAAINQAFSDAHFQRRTLDDESVPDLSNLLMDLFIFWASEFSYSTRIASLRRKDAVKENASPLLYLEDPIEIDRNLGSYLNRDSQRILRNEFIRVCVLQYQWIHRIPRHLLLQSLTFNQNDEFDTKYSPEMLHECILRPRSLSSQYYTMTGDVLFCERSLYQIELINHESDATMALNEISHVSVIGFDCEGSTLSREGEICIVSIAAGTRVFLFDIYSNPGLMALLKPLLEDETIVKVVHDCRKDSDALYHQYKIILTNVFDTQVGHAMNQFQNIKKVKDGMKCFPILSNHYLPLGNGRHECIGLSDLLWHYLSIQDRNKNHVKFGLNKSTWISRPLSDSLIQYAGLDVVYLPVLYRIFNSTLSSSSLVKSKDRIERYLTCRNWKYTKMELFVGEILHGYINNITEKYIYVNVSPTISVGIPVTNSLPQPGDLVELNIGDCIGIKMISIDENPMKGIFHDINIIPEHL